jgi:hypothetical protein
MWCYAQNSHTTCSVAHRSMGHDCAPTCCTGPPVYGSDLRAACRLAYVQLAWGAHADPGSQASQATARGGQCFREPDLRQCMPAMAGVHQPAACSARPVSLGCHTLALLLPLAADWPSAGCHVERQRLSPPLRAPPASVKPCIKKVLYWSIVVRTRRAQRCRSRDGREMSVHGHANGTAYPAADKLVVAAQCNNSTGC